MFISSFLSFPADGPSNIITLNEIFKTINQILLSGCHQFLYHQNRSNNYSKFYEQVNPFYREMLPQKPNEYFDKN